MAPRGRGRLAAAAAIAVLAGGCGGEADSAPDPERVEQVATDYAHAFGAGDGERACALLTPAARDRFTASVATLVGTRDCAEAVSKLQAAGGASVTGRFADAEVEDVEVNGERATATIVAEGESEPVTLEKRDGEWLLSEAPGT